MKFIQVKILKGLYQVGDGDWDVGRKPKEVCGFPVPGPGPGLGPVPVPGPEFLLKPEAHIFIWFHIQILCPNFFIITVSD